MFDLQMFYGPNAGYALELLERYRRDPASVDPASRSFFDSLDPADLDRLAAGEVEPARPATARLEPPAPENQPFQIPHVVAATALAHAIRSRGHWGAHLDPLGSDPPGDPALKPETHGITEEDLAKLPPMVIGGHAAELARNAHEAVQRLYEMYSGTISYQFDQVKSPEERRWLRDAVGLKLFHEQPQPLTGRARLRRLTQVEAFERFLHQTFVGQKRFSLEGNDSLVPMLDEIVEEAAQTGTREIVIGMAHRGRLNVLAHVLQKPYAAILSEFMHGKHDDEAPSDSEAGETEAAETESWSGDVKYHQGAEQELEGDRYNGLKIILAPNPSHLEYVNPVIEGMTRAAQERRDRPGPPQQEVDRALAVLIHGDAAFPGEGIVAETLNLWFLRGYWVGGTIHIIVNNQIGFTTEPEEGRSTHFASDLAKGFEIPIIHVNADDPDACLTAARLAKAYRDRFHKDILVDLIGYRRWGHNEGDEPSFTQPQMYERIRSHPTVRELYARRLEQQGLIGPGEAEAMLKEAWAALEQAKAQADRGELDFGPADEDEECEDANPPPVAAGRLVEFNNALLDWPDAIAPNPKLVRLIQRRAATLGPDGGIDWGQAESLAFAAILADGTAIRLTGQDSERGTFSHRHAVLHDQRTGATYTPLQHLPQARASFAVHNSPISEAAALGFEYGYSVRADDALVIWEAQFGDFANVAQVIIDQFIASGRAKWRQEAGLVLLLPHGYEGQGPEHSSARLERFLQLSAGRNWRIANCSTAAQYYHLLRKQAFELRRDPRPLVVMTPKSLLRHPLAASRLDELAGGTFRPVLNDPAAQERAGDIRNAVLTSGKLGIDLLAHPGRPAAEDRAILRLEQLYPFPARELEEALAVYPNLQQVTWAQEEPRNMGAWTYLAPHLSRLLGGRLTINWLARPDQSSPATGFQDRYHLEQEQLTASALRAPVKELGGRHGR